MLRERMLSAASLNDVLAARSMGVRVSVGEALSTQGNSTWRQLWKAQQESGEVSLHVDHQHRHAQPAAPTNFCRH